MSPFAAALTARNNKAAQAILEKNPSAAEQVKFLAFLPKRTNFSHLLPRQHSLKLPIYIKSLLVPIIRGVTDGIHIQNLNPFSPSPPKKVDKKGRNFLHVAIQNCDMESVMFLLSVEVDVNSRVQDATLAPPLHLAAAAGNEVLLRSLLLAGARPNDRDALK